MNYFQMFIVRIKVSDPEFVFDFLLHLVNILVYTNTCHWQWMRSTQLFSCIISNQRNIEICLYLEIGAFHLTEKTHADATVLGP